MTKEILRELWDEKRRLLNLVEAHQLATAANLTDDQRFDLEIEYRALLKILSAADRTYDRALEAYTKEQALEMCAVAENLDIRAARGR